MLFALPFRLRLRLFIKSVMEDCFLVAEVDKTGVVGSAMYIFLSESKSNRSLVVISPICGTLGSCGGVRSDADRIGIIFGDGGSLRRSFVVGEESRGFRGVLGACFLK